MGTSAPAPEPSSGKGEFLKWFLQMIFLPFFVACVPIAVAWMTIYGGIETKAEEAVKDKVKTLEYEQFPVGSILTWGGIKSTVPENWQVCEGQTLPINEENEELYVILGNTWGGNDQEFRLPDFRGRFLRGVDEEGQNDPDSEARVPLGGKDENDVGSLQKDTIQTHKHEIGEHRHEYEVASELKTFHLVPRNQTDSLEKQQAFTAKRTKRNQSMPLSTRSPTTTQGEITVSSETRPKNVYVYWIIKVK